MASDEDVNVETNEALVAWGLDIESGLSEWEVSFLEDADRRLKQGRSLTAMQRNKLEQIIREKG